MRKVEEFDHCSLCKSKPDQFLRLQCAHHLCLQCASEVVQELKEKGSKKEYALLACRICGTKTAIVGETLSKLVSGVCARQQQKLKQSAR